MVSKVYFKVGNYSLFPVLIRLLYSYLTRSDTVQILTYIL